MKKSTVKEKDMTPLEHYVTRQKGTEPPFSHPYWNKTDKGCYYCLCCETKLFDSEDKFTFKSGWPAFDRPADQEVVLLRPELGWFSAAQEALCGTCQAHLGHMFESNETTGMHFCINGTALRFKTPE